MESKALIPQSEIPLPGINSRSEILAAIGHYLAGNNCAPVEVLDDCVVALAGTVVAGVGCFDGTWGAVAVDSATLQPVKLWQGDFERFADQTADVAEPLGLANAFLGALKSLKFSNYPAYIAHVYAGLRSQHNGRWSLGERVAWTMPEEAPVEALKGFVQRVECAMPDLIKGLSPVDRKWVWTKVRAARGLSGLASLEDAIDLLVFLLNVELVGDDFSTMGLLRKSVSQLSAKAA